MADPGLTNLGSCCRLCLSEKTESLKSVFDDVADDRSLQQKIFTSVAVEILLDDKLSTLICNTCTEKINNWNVFKQACSENQVKQEQWLQECHNEIGETTLQIKDEPTEVDVSDDNDNEEVTYVPEIIINGNDSPVKNESDEFYHEFPPALTPHPLEDDDMDIEIVQEQSQIIETVPIENNVIDPKKCTICSKIFTTSSNRKKHERTMHGIVNNGSISGSDIGSLSQDDRSQSSIDSQKLKAKDADNENQQQKIQFAAGLKLLQRNSIPPIAFENLSKIEYSYIEKCKAMATMYNSLRCACHNVSHPNLKGLLSHLRSLRIWFPVFTCYHCMITFTDRSTSTKHHLRCTRGSLETLIKLSNLRKRSEVKTRIYQNYKCTACKFMYSFHEDYCTHVDEEHTDVTFLKPCTCGRQFNNMTDYKDHVYISCLVEYYCDICFITVQTLDEFQKHAAELHDNSEGFVLLQDDNYRQRKSITTNFKREVLDNSIIISGKRKSTFYNKPSVIEDFDEGSEAKSSKSDPNVLLGTTCPICFKEYSNHNNMLRHYRVHSDPNSNENIDAGIGDDSLYCCPDCGGMFTSGEWEKHKLSHKKKSCSECGKVFQFQSELDQHRSVHLNLKLYRDSKTQAYKSTMINPNNEGVLLMCEFCDMTFISKEDLKKHKLTHEVMPNLEASSSLVEIKNRKFACTICNKHYAGYGGLWSHNKKEHPDLKSPFIKEPKQCKYCDKVFQNGGAYFMHKQMHERLSQSVAILQKKPLNDPIGKSSYKIKKDDNINSDDDETESYHTCKRCFKVFSTRYRFKNHMKCHGINLSPNSKHSLKNKNTKKVWCNLCHSPFDNTKALEQHKNIEHSKSQDGMPILSQEVDIKIPIVFTCDYCVQTFTTKIALKKHKEKHAKDLHRNPKSVLVYCKHCKIAFGSTELLNKHMRDEHEQKYNPIKMKDKSKKCCKICNKAFTTMSALNAHQGWHKRGKVFDVVDTDTDTDTKDTKKNIKKEKLEFQCKSCSAVLPNNTALQIHILEKHRNVNATVVPARCMVCNIDFTSHEAYEEHKAFHSQPSTKLSKNFACTYCKTAFSRLDLLNAHIKQQHSIKQEFKCQECDRVFEKQNALNSHSKVHLDRKPQSNKFLFTCSICNMGFDLPKDLRNHTIKAHPF